MLDCVESNKVVRTLDKGEDKGEKGLLPMVKSQANGITILLGLKAMMMETTIGGIGLSHVNS